GDDSLHRDGLAFRHENFGQYTTGGRRDFGVHFVRGDLEDWLVTLDAIADLLEPFRKGPLGDRLAHLGHDDIYTCHRIALDQSSSPGDVRVETARSTPPVRAPGQFLLPTSSIASSCTARRFPCPVHNAPGPRRFSTPKQRSFRRRRGRRSPKNSRLQD